MSDEENHDEATVEEDTLKILIATDCHLGYGEKSSTGLNCHNSNDSGFLLKFIE